MGAREADAKGGCGGRTQWLVRRADAKDGCILMRNQIASALPSRPPEPPSQSALHIHLSPMAGVRGCNPLFAHIKQQSIVDIVHTDA